MPLALSFTVETDGRLPSGETLREAIEIVEDKTRGAPAYYMINCAHPKHFEHVLRDGGAWLNRIRGLRANSSTKSHAELDASTEIDIGNIPELAEHYRRLRAMLPKVTVLGGCCGTDHRHVEAIADSCLAA
jgi:homocysteine S-methyltransferase